MKTRELSRNARVKAGDVIVLQRVIRGKRHAPGLDDVKETIRVVAGPTDCTCEPKRVSVKAPRIAPFIDERRGHIATISLPGKDPIKLKLVSIQEMIEEEAEES